jgi:hypothetical protein
MSPCLTSDKENNSLNDTTTHRSKDATFHSPLEMTITDFAKTDAEQIE